MRKTQIIIIFVILSVSTLAGWAFVIIKNQELSTSEASFLATATASHQRLETMQDENSALQDENSALQDENSALQEGVASANSAISTATVELDVSHGTIDRQLEELSEIRSELSSTESRVEELEGIGLCDRRPTTIDYSSNSSASQSIKSWVENTQGSIDKAEWEVVWNNSKVSIHRVWGEFLWVYIVYFDDEDLGNVNSVFDFTEHCFLDY